MEAEISKRLARFGIDGPGRDWLVKCLDPACAAISPGLPDSSAYAVLRPEYRVTQVINPPTSLGSNGMWDLYMYTPPGDVNGLIWAAAPSPADFTGTSPPAGATTGYIQLQEPIDLQGAYAFVGVGTTITSTGGVRVASNLPQAFRHQYKSVTCELIAPAVADQGTVYAAQYQPVIGGKTLTYTGVPNVAAGTENFVKVCPTRMPLNEDQLTRMSVGYYEGRAVDGLYLPLRLCGPSQPFATFTSDYLALWNAPTSPNPGPCTFITEVSSVPFPSSLQPNPVWSGMAAIGSGPLSYAWVGEGALNANFASGSNIQGYDSGYDNTNLGVIIFRGLAGSVAGGFGASVQVKVIAGFEVVPSPQSADRVFVEPAASYDPRALQTYYAIVLELKDAYPAAYNDMGGFLDMLENVVSTLWKPARSIIDLIGGLGGMAGLGSTGSVRLGAKKLGKRPVVAPLAATKQPRKKQGKPLGQLTASKSPSMRLAGSLRRKRKAATTFAR